MDLFVGHRVSLVHFRGVWLSLLLLAVPFQSLLAFDAIVAMSPFLSPYLLQG